MSRILFVAKSHSDGNAHEQTIIFRQLFVGHVIGSRPMKIERKIYRMIKLIIYQPTKHGRLNISLTTCHFQKVITFYADIEIKYNYSCVLPIASVEISIATTIIYLLGYITTLLLCLEMTIHPVLLSECRFCGLITFYSEDKL